MAKITIQAADKVGDSRADINSNFDELYTAEGLNTAKLTADTTNVTSAGALMDSELTSIADVKALDQSVVSGAAPVLSATNFTNLPSGTPEGTAIVSTGETGAVKFLREDGDNTCSWQVPAGAGDALVANGLDQFAATTSLELKGVLSDETGSGAAVFGTSPTLVTPALGTPASGVATNLTGTASGLTAGSVTTNANLTGDVTSSGNATTIATDAVDIAMLSATGTAGSSTFLRGDNTWSAPVGSGDVSAASNITDNTLVRGDGGVKGVQDSGITIDDSDNMTGVTSIAATSTTANTFLINEKAASSTVAAGTGEVWVANDAPTTLRFTDDTDSDHVVVVQGGALGTPASGTATNLSGTAASLTAGSVTTNANLTGHVTSTGNAAVLGSFTTAQLNTAISDGSINAAQEGTALLSTGEVGGTKFLREDGDNTCSWQTIAGGGDALVANGLDQFAATTSAELAGVISNETGSGALVFGTSPTLVTPALGTPASGVATNLTGTAASLTAGSVTTNANLTGDVTSSGNATTIATDAVDIAMLSASGTADGTTFLRGDNTWSAPAGGGDALVANGLDQFAATTSLEFKGVISDETGSGAVVFATSPTLVTPALGTPASGVATNLTGTAASLTAGGVTTNANLTGHITSTGNAAILGSFTTAQLNTAISDNSVATGGGTASGTNTGDQTNISGNAATVTTNANLTGHITSTGNAAVLGSFTTAQLNTAISDGTIGSGDALVANGLDQFAATTSAELAGVISNETGSGALVFGTSPTFVTPVLGTPTSGNLATCTGKVGVYREVYVNAGAMIPRTTSGAASGTTELATNDIMLDTMDFDTAADEGVGFGVTLPAEWDASTVKFQPHWTAASGSGTVEFEFSARAYADSDAIDQAVGTAIASLDTLITANDMHLGPATAAVTIAGTPVAGEPIYVSVIRDVSTDTLGVDAQLIGVTLQYKESTTDPSIF